MISVVLRAAEQMDERFLWECLAIAAREPTSADAAAIPSVARYLAGWMSAGDFGVVAVGADRALGGAWARQFTRASNPLVFIDENTPELAIGTLPSSRGLGIGTRLLGQLVDMARDRGCNGLCLNVREGSDAIRLYVRLGFKLLPAQTAVNRTGGRSLAMHLPL